VARSFPETPREVTRLSGRVLCRISIDVIAASRGALLPSPKDEMFVFFFRSRSRYFRIKNAISLFL